MIATKPLRPKNIYSRLSISIFLKEYDYPEFLIISTDTYFIFKAICNKQAKNKFRKINPNQKILTIKRLKNL